MTQQGCVPPNIWVHNPEHWSGCFWVKERSGDCQRGCIPNPLLPPVTAFLLNCKAVSPQIITWHIDSYFSGSLFERTLIPALGEINTPGISEQRIAIPISWSRSSEESEFIRPMPWRIWVLVWPALEQLTHSLNSPTRLPVPSWHPCSDITSQLSILTCTFFSLA